jgi:arylsulfatase A-like enzyme
LAAPNNPLIGEVEGAQLIDIAPTLLELGGYDIPDAMQGRSLVSGVALDAASGLSVDEEEILRERLSGLGYIS